MSLCRLVASFPCILPRKTPQQIPGLRDSTQSAHAFTRTPHDALALLNPAPPPLITHYPHSRASFFRPDKQSLSPTKSTAWLLPWKDSTHQTHY